MARRSSKPNKEEEEEEEYEEYEEEPIIFKKSKGLSKAQPQSQTPTTKKLPDNIFIGEHDEDETISVIIFKSPETKVMVQVDPDNARVLRILTRTVLSPQMKEDLTKQLNMQMTSKFWSRFGLGGTNKEESFQESMYSYESPHFLGEPVMERPSKVELETKVPSPYYLWNIKLLKSPVKKQLQFV